MRFAVAGDLSRRKGGVPRGRCRANYVISRASQRPAGARSYHPRHALDLARAYPPRLRRRPTPVPLLPRPQESRGKLLLPRRADRRETASPKAGTAATSTCHRRPATTGPAMCDGRIRRSSRSNHRGRPSGNGFPTTMPSQAATRSRSPAKTVAFSTSILSEATRSTEPGKKNRCQKDAWQSEADDHSRGRRLSV